MFYGFILLFLMLPNLKNVKNFNVHLLELYSGE